ncbi:MAG: type II secretion system protein [Verrucomicrobiae bacterium]|nr:type II secretion system protein [Verrucomicrobiae bacterium]
MKHHPPTSDRSRNSAFGSPAAGWTLIEALGVLAVLAVLSAVFIPWMLRDLDSAARSEESRALTAIASALEQAIRRERVVPDATRWAAMAATGLGSPEDRIRTNARGGRRVWIVDPRLRLGPAPGETLPFAQSAAGSQAPTNARVILVSSLGEPLPSGVQDGVAASDEQFDAIWSAPPETVPPGWAWDGRAEDLAVQRLDFTGLWVPVLLNQPATGPRGQFGTDLLGTNPAAAGAIETWYLRGTVLRLHDAEGGLQWRAILQAPLTLTFERGAWRGRASLVDPAGHWNGAAVDDAMTRFLGAAENPGALDAAPPATRESVWRSMSNYFNAYLDWSEQGFPSAGSSVQTLNAATANLDAQTGTLLARP